MFSHKRVVFFLPKATKKVPKKSMFVMKILKRMTYIVFSFQI